MDKNYTWIDSGDELARELEPIRTGPVALDLEADSLHHFREKACLIQFTAEERNLLIDPLAGPDLGALGRILSDPAILKVFHGSDYDLRLLQRDFGLEVRGLFDTMIAARLVGEPAFGLAALLESYLGVQLDKRFQRADWSRRPLPSGMLDYAVSDTVHLCELAALLRDRLVQAGRLAWAEEEFRILENVQWNDAGRQEEAFLRVKGAGKLDPQGLAVLREVFRFRDVRAEKRDLPRFKVLRDSVLLELARKRPETPAELDNIRELPRVFSGGSGLAQALLRAVRKGVEGEPFHRPQARSGRRKLDPGVDAKVRALLEARDREAEGLGLEPSMLGSRKVLTGLVLLREEGGDWRTVEGLRAWQAAVLEPLLP